MEIANLPAFVSGLVGLLGLVGAAIAYLAKLRPETKKIEVDTADKLVSIAERAAGMANDTATDLRERNAHLDDRVTALSGEIGELREQLRAMPALAAQVQTLTAERDQLHGENEHLRGRVTALEAEVDRLRGSTAHA